ncbi:MAG: glutaredoxin domain-containing protein [Thiogranum sp.]
MAKIESYSKEWYPCCSTAKVLLRNKDLGYAEIDVSPDAVREQDEDRALTAPVGAAVLHR